MRPRRSDSPLRGGMIDLNYTLIGWHDPNPGDSNIAQALGVSQAVFEKVAQIFDSDFETGFQVGMTALNRMHGIVTALGRADLSEGLEKLVRIELDEMKERTYLLHYALEALREVHDADYKLVLCSNDSPYGIYIARHHGLLHIDVMDDYVFSCTCRVRKPQPAIYQQALKVIRCSGGQAFLADDGGDGALKGAKNCDRAITTIRTEHPNGKFEPQDPNDPAETGDYVISGIAELPAFLESLS